MLSHVWAAEAGFRSFPVLPLIENLPLLNLIDHNRYVYFSEFAWYFFDQP